jgi:hypothetical protein
MEDSNNTLIKQGARLLEAITIASNTPLIIKRLKNMLYRNRKQPHEILNKNAAEPQGKAFNYQLTQSYSVIRTGNN